MISGVVVVGGVGGFNLFLHSLMHKLNWTAYIIDDKWSASSLCYWYENYEYKTVSLMHCMHLSHVYLCVPTLHKKENHTMKFVSKKKKITYKKYLKDLPS